MNRPTAVHLKKLFLVSIAIFVHASDESVEVPSSPVTFVLENKGGKLVDGQNCILRINSLIDSRIVYRYDATLGKSQTILLPSGEYEASAVVYDPMHTAVMQFHVPRKDDVTLELNEDAVHYLKIKVVNRNNQPIEGCNLKLSFDQNRYARILNSKSGNQHIAVSDNDGFVRFVLQGTVPEKSQIYTSSSEKVAPFTRTITRSDWAHDSAMTLKLTQKQMNGRMNCFLVVDGKKFPFSEGVDTLIDPEAYFAILRLVSANDERADFSFRFQGDVVELFGLEDGEYLVQRVDLIAKGILKRLVPTAEVTINVKDSSLSKNNKAVTLVVENKTPLAVSTTVGTESEAEASIRGRVTYNGKPVSDAYVLISLGQRQEFSRTDKLGRYEIPVSIDGGFLLGVNFEGFTEFLKVESAEDEIERVVDLDLSSRFPVTIDIKGRQKGLIGPKAALYVIPKGLGEPAAFFDIPRGGMVETTAIEGPYELYIVTLTDAEHSDQDSLKNSKNYIVYDVGEIVLTRQNRLVTLSLDEKPASMSLKALMNELHSRFNKGS
jgi:hypothetical protein